MGAVLAATCLVSGQKVLADARLASRVFEAWENPTSQYYHREFDDVKLVMPKRFQSQAQKIVNESHADLKPFKTFLSLMAGRYWLNDDHKIQFTSAFKKSIKKVYPMLDHNISALLKFFKHNGMATDEINQYEAKVHFQKVIDKYNLFADLLCADPEGVDSDRHFALANRFFEYCYEPATWPEFKHMLSTPVNYPLLRMLHAVLWYNLAGNGWRNWHTSTLQAMKKACDQGKEIVYIAGGCDVYNLMKHGIYSIRVIDPMLPTQPRYYISDWQWFVEGQLGDSLEFNFDGKRLMMKRTNVREHGGVMRVKDLNNKSCVIKEAETTWTLYDHTNTPCGQIVFDRRYTKQADFVQSKSKELLMSFNELYYIITTGDDHWGIDLEAFADDMNLHIKQLRKPVTKEVMRNMRFTDGSSYQFIKLGTAVCEP